MEKRKFPEPQAVSKNPRPPIPLYPVESSQVKAVGYDHATNTLAVTFHRSNHVYHYPGVDADTHAAFINADSIGNFFGKHIKRRAFEKFALEQHAHSAP